MSYEIAGRMGWLVSWLDHWRGRAYENYTARGLARNGGSKRGARHSTHWWTHWVNNLSSGSASLDEDLISQSLAARHLRESVEQLPSHEQQVLLLHVNNGLTYWEIAARLGMDEEVVLRDLAHAYSQLRLELRSDELRR